MAFSLILSPQIEIMKRIAIFASGNGSNAENIALYFKAHPLIKVEMFLSNNPNAKVLSRAHHLNIPAYSFSRQEFYQTDHILNLLDQHHIDFIVLAGFMWLVPQNILQKYHQRMVNIHPALLPKYGGKGMYGDFVHQAVSEAGEIETGITIHMVNEKYDEGDIIFQKQIDIEAGENPEQIAKKVHQLEYEYFPKVIGELLEFTNHKKSE